MGAGLTAQEQIDRDRQLFQQAANAVAREEQHYGIKKNQAKEELEAAIRDPEASEVDVQLRAEQLLQHQGMIAKCKKMHAHLESTVDEIVRMSYTVDTARTSRITMRALIAFTRRYRIPDLGRILAVHSVAAEQLEDRNESQSRMIERTGRRDGHNNRERKKRRAVKKLIKEMRRGMKARSAVLVPVEEEEEEGEEIDEPDTSGSSVDRELAERYARIRVVDKPQ
jgi:hypothetical protein